MHIYGISIDSGEGASGAAPSDIAPAVLRVWGLGFEVAGLRV